MRFNKTLADAAPFAIAVDIGTGGAGTIGKKKGSIGDCDQFRMQFRNSRIVDHDVRVATANPVFDVVTHLDLRI